MPAGLDGNPNPIVTPQRTDVISAVAQVIGDRREVGRPMLVAVDGMSGAGKSTFADELAKACAAAGHSVVRSTTDLFHNPRVVRWSRGKDSPVGFYFDSHDLDSLRMRLLEPFRSGEGATYVAAIFDEPSDTPVEPQPSFVDPDDVLIFDGLFLQRPELHDYWDLVIYIDGNERENLRRLGLVMDDLPDTPEDAVAHVLEWARRLNRYASGTTYYVDLVDPIRSADIVIDNNNFAAPKIIKQPNLCRGSGP